MSEQRNPSQQSKKTSYNLLLGAGIAFVMAGIFLLGALAADIDLKPSVFRHLVWALLGGGLLFLSIVKVRKVSVMFPGLFLVLSSILLFFIDTNVIPCTLEALWPLVVIIGGLSLLAAGLFVSRQLRASQLIPSVALVLLGGCCLLFSLNIIREPFSRLASRWWPLALILAGVCLVVLFFVWNKRNIQMEDEAEDEDFNDAGDER